MTAVRQSLLPPLQRFDPDGPRTYNPPRVAGYWEYGVGAMGCPTCLHGECTGRCQKDDKGKEKKRKKKHKDKKHKKK